MLQRPLRSMAVGVIGNVDPLGSEDLLDRLDADEQSAGKQHHASGDGDDQPDPLKETEPVTIPNGARRKVRVGRLVRFTDGSTGFEFNWIGYKPLVFLVRDEQARSVHAAARAELLSGGAEVLDDPVRQDTEL